MRIYEIINKKKRGIALTSEEIRLVVEGFTLGDVPDYQMAALLMAIYFRGMNAEETTTLTMAMVDSGERVDLTCLDGVTVDKHSTGGVGDKTTLIVVPIVAALGLPVAKMSGRGLGHTGGTIDKLEAIPGFRTNLSGEEFLDIVKTHGLCIAGQSANLAPADKKLYALRDVTATVDSIPLIAASIMSKKIASGAQCILLDVKTGSGAFMKDLNDAIELARAMVEIGQGCGRKTSALITDMSVPLGYAIGNSLELKEVIQILSGDENPLSNDLKVICQALAANMLFMAGCGNLEKCHALVMETITSGKALKKLADMVEAQGGDRVCIENPALFPKASCITPVLSTKSGYISEMDTEGIGLSAMMLGAGREKPEDVIDYDAGIILHAKKGDYIKEGQPLADLHTSRQSVLQEATARFLSSLSFSQEPLPNRILIYDR